MPSKPHSPRRIVGEQLAPTRGTARRRRRSRRASRWRSRRRRTAASNGNSCSSRSSRAPMCAGAWFMPPSASPWPTMCLAVAMTPSREVGALERLDVRAAELGGEVRVLAVGLLDAAPARVAGDVEDRRQRMAGAGQQHPPADGRRHRGDDVGVEARGGPDRLLEARRRPGDEAVQAFLVDDRRDPESRLLDQVALDRVGRLGHLDGSQVRRPRQPGDLADAVAGQGGQPRPRRGPIRATTSKAQNEPSWATFSARVMRASRSATRASTGSAGSR